MFVRYSQKFRENEISSKYANFRIFAKKNIFVSTLAKTNQNKSEVWV